jgi:serine/threonine-protein kinase
MTRREEPLLLIDTELAGCRIVEEIGWGGMAAVYRAYQIRLERWVAIKVLHSNLLGNREILTRFRREAKAVAALRHPNILTIYDYGEEQGMAYIVMEYVEGGTLHEHRRGEIWNWPSAIEMLIPVGHALSYAHEQGIVHRDVKPANILLPRDDWPLLSDFGLIKLLASRQQLTSPGVSLGTPLYTAPEQMMGKKVDHRADLYALALILYELVAGCPAFSGSSLANMVMERTKKPPVSPRRFNQAVPLPLEDIILRALSPDPDQRYSCMDEFVTELDKVLRTAPQEGDEMYDTQVMRRERFMIGPRLSVSGTGIPLLLPPKREVLIGRSVPHGDKVPDVDFSVHGGAQAGVSRIHARLVQKKEQWYLTDLRSTNGTFVNEQQIKPDEPVQVKDGDCLCFGRMRVTLQGT